MRTQHKWIVNTFKSLVNESFCPILLLKWFNKMNKIRCTPFGTQQSTSLRFYCVRKNDLHSCCIRMKTSFSCENGKIFSSYNSRRIRLLFCWILNQKLFFFFKINISEFFTCYKFNFILFSKISFCLEENEQFMWEHFFKCRFVSPISEC